MKQKTILIFLALVLCCVGTANAQGPVKPKMCATCGKMVVNCPYKGNHPKCATCGKLKDMCAYKGNHPAPQKTQPVRPNKTTSRITYTVNGVSFDMIRVEAGTFQMGSDSGDNNEKPFHLVTLTQDYYMGETEVTQELWQAVMGSNPSYKRGSQNPVEQVSWNACQSFIKKLNQLTGEQFRLPTEAEWEFAAKGGNKSKGYRYAGSNTLDDVAWYWDNSGGSHHPVKGKGPNELDIYDMSGNVDEWTSSYWRDNYNAPEERFMFVIRGGCWGHVAWSARVSSRYNGHLIDNNINLGFRLALEP